LDFIQLFEGELPHLNAAGSVFFSNAGEESLLTCQDLYLRNDKLRVNAVLAITRLVDRLAATHDEGVIGRAGDVGHIGEASEGVIVGALVKVFVLVALVGFFLLLEVIEVNIAVERTTREAHVVFEPINAAHLLLMAFTLEVGGVFSGVEVVNVDVGGAHSRCEHVSAIAELDLTAILGDDGLIFLNAVRQDIHELDLVVEGHHDVEAARVESNSAGFFAGLAAVADLEAFLGVVPNVDVALRAGHDELLAEADVHAGDAALMEGRVDRLGQRRRIA
jgi:hypothetical protein